MSDCSGNCSCGNCADLELLIPADGQPGAQGEYGGSSAEYKFDTSNAGNPAAGFIQTDNANLSAAIKIYVAYDSVDTSGSAMTVWLGQITSSTNTNKAVLRLFSKTDSSKFADYTVTAGASGASWQELTVTCTAVSSNSPFANNDPIVITYDMCGDKGTNGTNGTNGTTVLSNDLTPTTSGNTTGLWVVQKTYSLAAADIANNGDVITVAAEGLNTDASYATDGAANLFGIEIVNNAVSTFLYTPFSSYLETIGIKIEINRVSSTSALISCTYTTFSFCITTDSLVTGLDFSLATTINVEANTTVAGVTTQRLIVKQELV